MLQELKMLFTLLLFLAILETFYHFGDNDRARWDSLFSLYQLPPLPLPGKEPVLSFGLAGEWEGK